ncbi:Beta-1,3-galactosyl-O-glycosyl-glycoprotein beta-1,6-N-acetylglucosaminyltransferase 7 [Heterocephalus glaber]|uniref:Beta-1,3-galactosyl-O-glycosyl-glycoprotein beta-1,6-N-acetylglucosaminyltransferase 7 n=1 Tax=Heterocephalus glaber TaxID=10181 RepID=G5CBD7_HETGA|nr:Beta-1,3-galactosyl-O-glycosyl-glycoprotein beta-1,6-N-acetylglucosaminyltransferase 7 [Heterocephalus glaber]
MSQLRATHPGLLVCTVICILIFLYVRNLTPEEPEEEPTHPAVVECGFYPDELCSALFEGKGVASQIAKFCKNPHGSKVLAYLHKPGNCSRTSRQLRFITRPLSAEEGNFSLAYIITPPKELAMFVQLLRAIYVPQNVYCIHVDEKAQKKYKTAVKGLVSCFENIFISSKRQKVAYSGLTRLQATSQSHPESSPTGSIYASPNERFKHEPPHNLTIYFGSAYYVLRRKFVDFILTDVRAKDMLQWSRDIHSPERHYWVTLNRLKDAPGATPDAGWEGDVRAIKWRPEEGKGHDGCRGHYVQDTCVYGLGDLPWIIQSPSLFANKFEPSADPLVVMCLERWHRLKVLQQAEVSVEPHWRFQQQSHFDVKPNH